MSEAQIQAVTIGGVPPENVLIELSEYDESWPGQFAREATRIRQALGDAAIRIEHVGSTSVPGLAAKPTIDIVLEVGDSSDEPAYLQALRSRGYVLRIREPDWWEHRMLKGPDTDVNLHVFSVGCPEVDRMLRFRDHLRADPADRQRYCARKRELAARRWKYVQNYADAKTSIVEEFLARANP